MILPVNQRAQAEPHIARSFSDPDLLIATWQSGRYASGGGAIGNEYGISRDGGFTWTRDFVPGLTQNIDGGPFERATDPVGGISFDNIIFQNSLGYNWTLAAPPSWVSLSKMNSADAGLGAPTASYQDQWPMNYADKNWMAINTFPESPTYKQIAVACTVYELASPGGSATNNRPVMVVSDDDGVSWSPEVRFGPDQTFGFQPAYLPNGNLVVIYRHSMQHIAVSISEDGGQTFGPSILAVTNIPFSNVPGIRDGVDLPSLTTDRLRGILYVTWQERSPTGQYLIQFSRSIDGGHTWSTPVNARDANVGVAFNPAICASPDGQHVSILFYDSRGQVNQYINHVYLAESFDGGETWGPNLRVSELPSDFRNGPLTPTGYFYGDYHAITPALDFDTPGVATWIDGRNGNPDPYVAQIARTQGTTFEAWRQLRFTASELADPNISGEAGDPEPDGIPNCIEYICGLEPDEVDVAPFEVSGFTGPNSIELSYTALPVVTDKEIFWEKSTDLSSWQEVTPVSTQNVRATKAAFQRYTVQFTGQNILFLRMGARNVPE